MHIFLKLIKTIVILFLILPNPLFSQQLDHVLGDILIQLHPEKKVGDLKRDFLFFDGKITDLKIEKNVVTAMNIWLLKINHNQINEFHFLEKMKKHPSIANAQFNHFVNFRSTTPNDPQFFQQWQYLNDGVNGLLEDADIDADLAWDIATGGLTPNGDTIVVCVIDGGIDQDHEDIKNNLWFNHAEIPGDGQDNDNNGFTDDYRGWNSFNGTDNVYTNDDHGTAVAGIIGAEGNNGIGVAGVNWNIKIMVIAGGSGVEDEVLTSYSYPLTHRKKYNASNGTEGAFVVATNSSWGIEMGQPDDFPLWCAMYDSLGTHGILNCGATANSELNVEVDGDMPTGCTSDFLISVTNTTSADMKFSPSGYGAISIDLGAPGAESWTIGFNNGYDNFGGTSAATPHVAGAIGLLYSAPCSNLADLALADPIAAAMQVRQYILEGVDPNPSLDGITVTGGRLNVFNSISILMDSCGACPPPTSLTASNITTTGATLSWIENNMTESINLRYRETGTVNWTLEENISLPFLLSNLITCKEYEVQVASICSGASSNFTPSYFFSSDGCCEPPNDLSISLNSNNDLTANWTSVTAALSYNLILSSSDPDISQMTVNTANTNFEFVSLQACTEYFLEIQTVCDTGTTAFSTPIIFTTNNCGGCIDLDYCEISSGNADDEWIENVTINTLNNTSGSDAGYGDFTNTMNTTDLEAGMTYTLSVTPGYSFSNFLEYFKTWIDFNQDGDFDDVGEEVLDPVDPMNMTVSSEVQIPADAVSGLTRMRVMMRWGGNPNPVAMPCLDIDFGEIEDYCVNIVGGTGIPCLPPSGLDTSNVTLNKVTLNWNEPTNAESYILQFRELGAPNWINLPTTQNVVLLLGLTKCTTYEAAIQTKCDNLTASNFSDLFLFSTACDVGIEENVEGVFNLNIFPNPFSNHLNVTFELNEAADIHFELLTADGRLVFQENKKYARGKYPVSIFTEKGLPQGIYFFKIKTEKRMMVKKLIKQ